MTSQRHLVCWDSNCFIAVLADEAGRADICLEILEQARLGEIDLCASYLALVETVKIPSLDDEETERRIRSFFDSPFIEKLGLNDEVATEARRLQRIANLDPRDAIHLATAIIAGADALHTYDRDLLRIDCQALALPIAIEPPQPPQAIPQQT